MFVTVKYLQQHNPTATLSVLTCANKAKLHWNGRRAASVIDYVLRATDFNNFDTHYTYYRPEQENDYFIEMERRLWDWGVLDTHVEGTTKNPPDDVKVTRKDGEVILLREYGGNIESRNDPTKPNIQRVDYPNEPGKLAGFFVHPWINVDKKFIADQYVKFGLEEDLLPLTRSCEARPEKTGYDPKIFGDELRMFEQPCGMCWWCLEKKWAFGHF